MNHQKFLKKNFLRRQTVKFESKLFFFFFLAMVIIDQVKGLL